jgi:hypothetical protein
MPSLPAPLCRLPRPCRRVPGRAAARHACKRQLGRPVDGGHRRSAPGQPVAALTRGVDPSAPALVVLAPSPAAERRWSAPKAACWPWAWVRRRCCARPPSASGTRGRDGRLCPQRRAPGGHPRVRAGALSASRCSCASCRCSSAAPGRAALWLSRAAHRVVVVGAGIGGLVSALLLAHRGLQVTLVEAAAGPAARCASWWSTVPPSTPGPRCSPCAGSSTRSWPRPAPALPTCRRCSRCRCWRATPGAAHSRAGTRPARRPADARPMPSRAFSGPRRGAPLRGLL